MRGRLDVFESLDNVRFHDLARGLRGEHAGLLGEGVDACLEFAITIKKEMNDR